MRWGLIPRRAKERDPSLHTFNARVETLSQKPTFRESFHHKRCIIPASGFYEWHIEGEGKQPYYIFRQDREPLALAGLRDAWSDSVISAGRNSDAATTNWGDEGSLQGGSS